jgi:ArsR family metal-binding transcriptional regulator
MLLTGYSMDILEAAACKPGKPPLYCVAHLADDITEVMPYLNAELGATGYTKEPPSMILDIQGHQIAVEPYKIIINDIQDATEAIGLLEMLQEKINRIWEKRDSITPKTTVMEAPKVMDVVALLPKTNCGLCGLPTCIVFADKLLKGAVEISDCPAMNSSESGLLEIYLDQFK